MLEKQIKAAIRDVKDFPKEGIIFKDITPILENPQLTNSITKDFVRLMDGMIVDAIMGVESRGFFWGPLIAQELGIPFIPVRKRGKLPYKTVSHKYDLEYGSAEIEVHEDAIKEGVQRCDDWTGCADDIDFRDAFMFTWNDIYKNDPIKSWEANPFVWKIEFEVVK